MIPTDSNGGGLMARSDAPSSATIDATRRMAESLQAECAAVIGRELSFNASPEDAALIERATRLAGRVPGLLARLLSLVEDREYLIATLGEQGSFAPSLVARCIEALRSQRVAHPPTGDVEDDVRSVITILKTAGWRPDTGPLQADSGLSQD